MEWAGLPVFGVGLSVKVVERESVKQLVTTALNSVNQDQTWQRSRHRDTAR